jgi:hypothetical protein
MKAAKKAEYPSKKRILNWVLEEKSEASFSGERGKRDSY